MLREFIRIKGYSQSEVAKKAGISLKALNNYINGRNEMPVSKAKKIAEILEVDWWKLYEEQ